MGTLIGGIGGIGGIGASGDTSCADHNISWRTRHALNFVPPGVSARNDDNIHYNRFRCEPNLAADFSHPVCSNAGVDDVSASLAVTQKPHHYKRA
jgi:hypothetical protein